MKKHIALINFLALTIILTGGLVLFEVYRGDQLSQFVVGITMCLSYFFWGLLYHKIQKDLHPKVIMEYSLISLISILVLLVILRM